MSLDAIKAIATAVLVVMLLFSAVIVVSVTHENRMLVGTFQNALNYQQELQVEWGQLMIEQSTWAAHRRIENLATKELHMELPLSQDVVIVK